MHKVVAKQEKRERRRRRIRAKIAGTSARPRLAIFRSNRALYAQLIDDDRGVTVAAVKSPAGTAGLAAARTAGEELAVRARKLGVLKVVFDRGGFSYLGAIRAFADAARAGGLEF